MGITGLLPFLEQKPCHISAFRGGTVAIDTYCWLHKGAVACAEQLIKGEDSQLYVNYCLKYVNMLLSNGVHPILVFDGKSLPAKSETEAKRRSSRQTAKQRAIELLHLGKIEEARNYFRQCVNITPQMALNVIKECRKLNVDYLVAPYEADAQLAFLSLKGIADVIITEDSDLMLFGCNRVMYKMDIKGSGMLVEKDKIPIAMKLGPDKFSFEKFRYMCILSGCDYLPSLNGIGLKKALKFVKLTAETNPLKFLDKIPGYLNMKKLVITEEYKESFMCAVATFRHQIVFDPLKKKLVPLHALEEYGTDSKYCQNAGEIYDHDQAFQVALGNLNAKTFERQDNFVPAIDILPSKSIWSNNYKKGLTRSQSVQIPKVTIAPLKRQKSENDSEQIAFKTEQDLKISEELQFYSKVQEEIKEELEEEEIEEEAPLSPILPKNPFLKNISKLPRTELDPNLKVVSRYFNSTESESDIENISNNLDYNSKKRTSEVLEEVVEKKLSLDETQKPKSSDNLSKKRNLGKCRQMGLSRAKNQPTISSYFSKQ